MEIKDYSFVTVTLNDGSECICISKNEDGKYYVTHGYYSFIHNGLYLGESRIKLSSIVKNRPSTKDEMQRLVSEIVGRNVLSNFSKYLLQFKMYIDVPTLSIVNEKDYNILINSRINHY